MLCNIPEECKLNLCAKVIIAKNKKDNETILGKFDEYGEPVPSIVTVTDLTEDESVVCLNDYKVTFNKESVTENLFNSTKVTLSIPFTIYFWIKTTKGFKTVSVDHTYIKNIPVNEFIKLDGLSLTTSEFKENVDQSNVVVSNYELNYVNILPKVKTSQIIQVVITATIIDKLGKFRDIIVYGAIDDTACE